MNSEENNPPAATPPKVVRVLIVEDDALICMCHSRILADLGCVVTAVNSAEEALELLEKQVYSLIFTDMYLSNMNGFELRQKILKNALNKNTPVIAITSSYDFQKSGFEEYHIKPATEETFKGILERWQPLSFSFMVSEVVSQVIPNVATHY